MFNPRITFKPGKKNPADELSRLPPGRPFKDMVEETKPISAPPFRESVVINRIMEGKTLGDM